MFPVRACGFQGTLVAVDAQGNLYRFDLLAGKTSEVKSAAPLENLACGENTLWGIAEERRSLYRFDPNGQVLERLPQPTLIWDVAVDGAELVVARRPLAGGEKLLWRGKPPHFQPWALSGRQHPGLPPLLTNLANTPRISLMGHRGAAVLLFGKAELYLWAGEGPIQAVPVPSFVPASSGFGENPATWPRPFSDLLALPNGVWVLSGWEGPWSEEKEQMLKGRHVVHVSWDGKVQATYQLPRNGNCLASDDGERALVFDAYLGIWRVTDFPKAP